MNESAPRTRPAFIVILIGLGLLGALLAAEAALRLVENAGSNSGSDQIVYRFFRGYYTLAPNAALKFFNERRESIRFETDERGLRNPPQSFGAADTIVVGDSFIEAINTPAERTLTGELRMRGIAAYNAGVGGMSSFDAFHLLRDHLPDSGSKTVVLGFYLGNDFRDNYHGGIFEPEQTPSQPTGADTRSFKARAFDVTCGISAVCRKLYQQIWLGYVRGQATDPMASYPLSEIVMLRAADARADVAVAKTRTALTSLNELIAGRGGRLVVLGIPSRAQVLRSFKELSRFAEEPRAREFAEDTFRGNFSWDRPNELLAGLCAELAVEYVSLAAMAAREAVSKKPFDE